MNSSLIDETAIAQSELNAYIKAQVGAVAPEIIPLVAASIKVERVGFTKNASRTPYLVYKVGERRCCTFIKRRVFFDLIRILLKLRQGTIDRIRSITASPPPFFGLSVTADGGESYIPGPYVRKFFERYNQIAFERVVPQLCDCNDLYDMCLHSILNAATEFFE